MRPRSASCLDAGQRRDTLQRAGESFAIGAREIAMELAEIDVPTPVPFL